MIDIVRYIEYQRLASVFSSSGGRCRTDCLDIVLQFAVRRVGTGGQLCPGLVVTWRLDAVLVHLVYGSEVFAQSTALGTLPAQSLRVLRIDRGAKHGRGKPGDGMSLTELDMENPEHAAKPPLDELRKTEYSYLDQCGHIYLDYTGAGLAARSQLKAHSARIAEGCYGNPHSENPTSTASTRLVAEARAAVLKFFNTTADDYFAVFTPNATGACRLVGESYPFGWRRRFVHTADNHNSVNGIREFARARGARIAYIR
ncbi:MAG: aminotransferase class V-fold PLP-dependent enzyme [Mycobacterium sp.]|nr:aminotransferase class V-fold PLP-dependent enzyme [Mycobacterium sp.]